MLRLELAGVNSLLLSSLCPRCPQGRAGCCAAPPALAWADIGRIVSHGGRDFLLTEIREQRLFQSPRGLAIRRVPESDGFPTRCTYLGPGDRGCVLGPHQRSATCNYYLCDDAFVLAENDREPNVGLARRAHDRIAKLLGECDLELSTRVMRHFPGGPPWDAAFLDWLAVEFDEILRHGKNRVPVQHK